MLSLQSRADAPANQTAATAERRVAPPAMKPKADVRDFTGVYSPAEGAVSDTAAQTTKRGCVPGMVAGITGLTHIVMGREVMVLVREKDHQARRIYINGEHPKDMQPSSQGHSIGRFDRDTLVVETIGLKSGMTLVERLRKVDGGRQLETTVNGVATLANWRPDLNYVEDLCEVPAR
jgi:hypothetical protein